MKKISERKAGVILSYLNTGVGMIISIVYTPVMLRLLGQSEYGVYNAAASIISYLSLFTLGFGSSYMRFYARYKAKDEEKEIRKLNSTFLLVFGLAAFLALASGLVLATRPDLVFGTKFSDKELHTSSILLVLMAINLSVAFIDSVFSMYISALEKFTFQRIMSFFSMVLKPTVTLPLLILGYGSVGLTVASSVVTIGTTLTDIFFARKLGMRFAIGKPDLGLMKEISVFSAFIFLTSLAGTINSTIDKILLSRYEGANAVAVYEIGEKFNSYLTQFSVTISAVFVPQVNMMVAERNDNHELTQLMIKIGRIQLLLLAYILGGFAILGRFFIDIYTPDGYDASYGIAMMIMLASFIPYIQNIGIEIQKAKNMHIFRSVAYFVCALMNVAFSIPFIKVYGISGAAVGTALSVLIGNTISMNIYYYKGIKLEMNLFWKSVAPLLCLAIFVGSVGMVYQYFFNIDSILKFLVVGTVYSIVYLACMWTLGMNQYEKNLLLGFIPKRFRKG